MKFVDLHCHAMPYVDDGAADTEEAVELIHSEVEQGVTDICLTPHLRFGRYNTTDEKVKAGFDRLRDEIFDANVRVRLYLSREYFYDEQFVRALSAGTILPIGPHKVVLVEFDNAAPVRVLAEASKQIQDAGYRPMIAHVERLQAIQEDVTLARKLIDTGALMQMNAATLLGQEGYMPKHTAKALLDNQCVHVIASNSHDTEERTPALNRCFSYIERKYSANIAELLMNINPAAILYGAQQ